MSNDDSDDTWTTEDVSAESPAPTGTDGRPQAARRTARKDLRVVGRNQSKTDEEPQDIPAEQAMLGACMLGGDMAQERVQEVRKRVRPADFYRPHHEAIFRAICDVADSGETPDPITVRGRMAKNGTLDSLRRAAHDADAYLHTLIDKTPMASNATFYANNVHEVARKRRGYALSAKLRQDALSETSTADEMYALLATWIDDDKADTTGPAGEESLGLELDDFLADTPLGHDWLIEGLLERKDRLILTGGEGGGKSTLLRQMGVQLASGIHPFGGEEFSPVKVLILDLENSRRQIHRKIHPLRLVAGSRYQKGNLIVEVRTEGLDLTSSEDRDWYRRLLDRHRPDVLITGPAYKMAAGDPNEEASAKIVSSMIDWARATHDCAVLLEAHSPHASNGAKRPTRPYGASLWLRWPEFGLHIGGDGQVTNWRGPRDERDWPVALKRGGEWPWTPVTKPRDVVWAKIHSYCTEAGERLSYRDLAELTSTSVGTVQRAIKEHQVEWDRLGSE